MLSYLENYRKARLKNWIIIPPMLFSLMFLFFVMGMLFTAPAANIYNCYNVGFGALCDCMSLFIAVKFVYHAATTRNLYEFLEEGDTKGTKLYFVLVFIFLIIVIVCFLNISLDQILEMKDFMFEIVMLIGIALLFSIINFLSLKGEIIKFKNIINSLSETEEETLKEEVITLKDYYGSKFTKRFLIKFTPFTCTATDYNNITKASVKFEQGRYGTGGYYIKIYDKNSKLVGRVTIMYDNNAKNQLNAFLANLKLKCSNISFKFNRNLFWPK